MRACACGAFAATYFCRIHVWHTGTHIQTPPSPLLLLPYAEHIESIAALAKEYQPKGLAVVAISSNSIATHPQDGPEAMAVDAKAQGGCSVEALQPDCFVPVLPLIASRRCHCCVLECFCVLKFQV